MCPEELCPPNFCCKPKPPKSIFYFGMGPANLVGLPEGSIYIDKNSGLWYQYTNMGWVHFEPPIFTVQNETTSLLMSMGGILRIESNSITTSITNGSVILGLEVQRFYVQSTQPIGNLDGDIWIDTATNDMYKWEGSIWNYVLTISGGGSGGDFVYGSGDPLPTQTGAAYYDYTNRRLWFNNGGTWETMASLNYGGNGIPTITPPSLYDQYVDTNTGQLYSYYGSSWNPISGVGPTGPTGPYIIGTTGPTGPCCTGPTGPTGPCCTGPTGPVGPAGPSASLTTIVGGPLTINNYQKTYTQTSVPTANTVGSIYVVPDSYVVGERFEKCYVMNVTPTSFDFTVEMTPSYINAVLESDHTSFYSQMTELRDGRLVRVYKKYPSTVSVGVSEDGMGSGVWYDNDIASTTSPFVSEVVETPGNYTVFAYVTSTTNTIQLARSLKPELNLSWEFINIISGSYNIDKISLCVLANSFLAIVFHDLTSGDLFYSFSGDINGGGVWTSPIVVHSSLSAGYQLNNPKFLLLSTGTPAIFGNDLFGSQIYFIYSSTVTGSLTGNWSSPTGVGTAYSLNYSVSPIVLKNGNPAVAVTHESTNQILYSFGSAANGGIWTSSLISLVTFSGNTMLYADYEGYPAIITFGGLVPGIVYMVNNLYTGAGIWSVDSVVSTESTVKGMSMVKKVNGHPSITFQSYISTSIYVQTITSGVRKPFIGNGDSTFYISYSY
jgi:hypothetical protein